jgi:biotin carboxylase
MKVAKNKEELQAAMDYAKSLGSEAFGLPAFYIEKYITRAKHIRVSDSG